jgi:hypothetical protein
MKDIIKELKGKEPMLPFGEGTSKMAEALQDVVITRDNDSFTVKADTALEFVKGHKDYHVYVNGANNIVRCILDPANNNLSLDGQRLMSIMARLPTEEDSKDLLQRELDLIDKGEYEQERRDDLRTNMRGYTALMIEVEQKLTTLINKMATAQGVMETRDIMEEVHALRERRVELSELEFKAERAMEISIANSDAIEADLRKLRDHAYSSVSNAARLLMSYHGSDDEASRMIPIGDKIKIRDALQPRVLEAMRTLESAHGNAGTMERALFPRMGALFKGSVDLELREFMKTEEARVLQLVYEMALDMKEIRDMKPADPKLPARQYNLFSDSVTTTNNPLMSEMHILNLITLAGYNPNSWAQSFGIRISGIAKQILNGWGGGNRGPLKAEGLRNIFRVDTKPLDIRIDYTKLEFDFELEKRRLLKMGKIADKQKGEELPDVKTEVREPQQSVDDIASVYMQ